MFELIEDFYYNWKAKIYNFCYYGYHFQDCCEFDASVIYKMIYVQLDTLYNYSMKHGHLEWNASPTASKLMKKLRIARELAKRLDKSAYLENQLIPLYQRFPDWEPRGLLDNRERTEADAMFTRIALAKHSQEAVEHKQLMELLDKYLRHWWD